MYVRHDLQERLRPPVHGWHNVRCPNFVAQEQITFRKDALRFEAGSYNFLGLAGLNAAMELLLELGIDNIAAELLRKRNWLVPALQAKGYQVAAAGAPLPSGMVAFYRPDADLPALHQKLMAANVITSMRVDRGGQRHIRISPHFYNTDAELHRTLDLL
jgi:selenocysteine lyase/cysteine desulfurase